MDSPITQSQALTSVISRILRPLIRTLLRNGMSFKAFSDSAKRVHAEIALTQRLGLLLVAPTWRANPDRAAKLGSHAEALADEAMCTALGSRGPKIQPISNLLSLTLRITSPMQLNPRLGRKHPST